MKKCGKWVLGNHWKNVARALVSPVTIFRLDRYFRHSRGRSRLVVEKLWVVSKIVVVVELFAYVLETLKFSE